MTTATSHQPSLEPGVAEFLRLHGAESHLQSACDLVRECFPELQAIRIRLQEDPDEDNHTWVVMQTQLPGGHSEQLLREQRKRYYDEVVRQPSLPYHPLSFSLQLDFSQE